MKKLIWLTFLLILITSVQLFSQSGYELLEKRQRDAEYYYIEFKTYFDQQDYYKALKKIEDAIDASPLHYNIAQFYFDKGEIYRKIYELYQRDSDIEESYAAYKESARLDNQPKTVFKMNYSLFEWKKNETVKLNTVRPDELERILDSMWKAILDYEEIGAWRKDVAEDLDEELHMFLEKCIDAGLLSRTADSYLAKVINTCRRGQDFQNQVVARQWKKIEDKMRIDEYNLPCSGNLYLGHKKALEAIREKSDRLYDHALNYYRAAVDTARTRKATAFIYNEMAHFVNSAPFFQLYDAVKYAGLAYNTLPAEQKYAEEYGEFLWLLVNHIIKIEIAGKETFAQKRESPKIRKAVEHLEKATRFKWSNQIQALILCSIYHEWLQTPWDAQRRELRLAQDYIIRAFELSPDKNDNIILNQLVKVHKKLGAEGIRKLRQFDEKYNLNISELAIHQAQAAPPDRATILLAQINELRSGLYEITLINYKKFIEFKDNSNSLSAREKNTPEYQAIQEAIRLTKKQLDNLFAKKVDLLYRIGYSQPQEVEIQTLSQQVFADNILDISSNTRTKVDQISVPDRMLRQ